ncbi:MAG: aminotransferase class I/II-fold pyridoxal phosphate-dependent enzyme [Faecalibacterium sp.]|jgi:histidinol-phosphate/aromatic aminotransferase/cobyric acid decarboxylase-like protein/choline kinase|nr:aminotransferase class I/II-fold pyridoxal phosphate-dependent enzyme [Faecalibacterium sp.]
MQGMILAAGMGKRLKALTQNNTKCMVKVDGVTMIERCLRILDKKHLSRVVIVVGYEGQKLMDYIATLGLKTPICFLQNPIYDKTNNIYSLSLAKDYLCAEDTLLLESDLVFEESLIDALLDDPRESLALVDKFESWMDGTCMELDEDDCIVNFIPGKHLKFAEKEHYYKTVNIYKFSRHFAANTYVPFLTAYEKAMGENEYYESVIKLIAMLDTKEIRAKRLTGQVWYEIDNVQDLDIAESLFAATPEQYYEKLCSRYGGYWRYPKLLDFCYLVNPYYPPQKLTEEMKSNFEILLTQYPSGMRVNALLASSNFGVKPEHILVGNGASELIKALMERQSGPVGCIRPTFEEYPNRYDANEIVAFRSSAEDFHYTADELIAYFDTREIRSLVLINPDNPSGNYIPRAALLRLIDWCKAKSIRLILDESFVDFAEAEGETTLLDEEILARYSGLYVVKSISKSYGVPGLRLGLLASSDEATIAAMKKSVAIWNINSFGEFYLQIMEKYNKDYARSLLQLQKSRRLFVEQLKTLPGLTVFPSQANYVMCELTRHTSRALCCALLQEDILIKDLTPKIGNGRQYIRLAVRNDADNEKLLGALQGFLRRA